MKIEVLLLICNVQWFEICGRGFGNVPVLLRNVINNISTI